MKRAVFIILLLSAALPVYAGVVINEVAWMGTAKSASDEWLELYSDTGQNLDGWRLITEDGGMSIMLRGTTTPGGYYLIERTNDATLPDIKADLISPFGKGLANSGEILILKDAGGNAVDRVDGSNGWAIGGDNDTKRTLQRTASAWETAEPTPRAKNAEIIIQAQPVPSPASGKFQPKVKAPAPSSIKTKTDNSNDLVAANKSEPLWLLGGIAAGVAIGAIVLIILRSLTKI